MTLFRMQKCILKYATNSILPVRIVLLEFNRRQAAIIELLYTGGVQGPFKVTKMTLFIYSGYDLMISIITKSVMCHIRDISTFTARVKKLLGIHWIRNVSTRRRNITNMLTDLTQAAHMTIYSRLKCIIKLHTSTEY